MSAIEIIGGVGLTLFGVRFLRKGLDRLFGGKLVQWLARMTANPFRAFVSGILVGTVAPSSTGISLVTAQLSTHRDLNSARMLAVLLGAGVGLTVTVQLLAFRVQDYAGLFVFIGVVAFQFLSREIFRGIGQTILSLGFIFLAMDLIGSGARGLTGSRDIVEMFHLLQGHPVAVFAFVSALTVLLQSSTASIALGLGLAQSGLVDASLLIPWVLGTNVGLGVNSCVAGWKEIESRRMGVGNLVVKSLITLPFFAFPEIARQWFEGWPGSEMRQTAMFHTGFNLLVGLVALPFLAGLSRVTAFLIPHEDGNDLTDAEGFLDTSVLDTPSLALARATRETLRMADRVRAMIEHFWKAFLSGNIDLCRRIQKQDDVIDRMNLDLKDYLSRIGEGKSQEDTHWQFALLTFSNELESVGDLIDKHLCDLLVKKRAEGFDVDPADMESLDGAYKQVLERMDLAARLLTTRSKAEAKALLAGKERFNDWCREVQGEHYVRLSAGSRSTLGSSSFFLDFLNALRRINSHISTIGYAFHRPCTAELETESRDLPSRASTASAVTR